MNENPPRNVFPIAVTEPQKFLDFPDGRRFASGFWTGAMRLQITTLSPLHTGAGNYGLGEGGGLVKLLARRHGIPIVPGSSIKGALRQIHEVITQSLGPFDRDPAGRGEAPTMSTRVFGSLRHQGRISFDDAVPQAPPPGDQVELSVPYPPPKDNQLGRRFYRRLPRGAEQEGTIPAEAIPAGVTLHSVLRFWNMLPDELGSVLAALGLDRFTPRLGGGKYDDLGWVRFRVTAYRRRQGLLHLEDGWVEDPASVAETTAMLRGLFRPKDGGVTALRTLEKELQGPEPEAADGGMKP